MKTVNDLRLFDVLTMAEDDNNITRKKQRIVYGINATPMDILNPSVLILNDFGEEVWVYLRAFVGYNNIPPTINYPSNNIH